MKAAVLCLALLSSCVLAAHAGFGRRLSQAPAGAPSDCPTVFDVAEENGLTSLVAAMTLDDLEPSLDNNTVYPLTYTVFAPTNEAIQEALTALATTVEDLDMDGRLNDILQYHFIIQPYSEVQLNRLGTVGTNFRNQTLSISDGQITAFGSNATIIQPDVPACQSVVHVIDHVLVPNFNAVAPPPGELAVSS